MKKTDQVELFILKCASLKHAADGALPNPVRATSLIEDDASIRGAVSQFSAEVRDNAILMAEHYKLFYMLENDIRRLIDDTLSEEHKSSDWWDKFAPPSAKDELKGGLQREQDAGFTPRSENPLD